MTFLDRLERRFAPFAIPGLIRYVVILNALVYLLLAVNPQYGTMLTLDREAVLRGEVWRLVSWIFIPETQSPIWIIFYLWFMWWISDSLEATWGTFRLNLYYLLGIIGSVIPVLLLGGFMGGTMLNLTLLLAAATLAPNLEILLFMILPVKLKWLAFFSLIMPVITIVFGPWGTKLAVLLCLGNYLLFFGPSFVRQAKQNREIGVRRARFETAQVRHETLHKCELCGITEVTNPQADFRVTDDDREFCTDHLPPSTR